MLHVDGRRTSSGARAGVLAMEERVVRAFGTTEEIAALAARGGAARPAREADTVTAVFWLAYVMLGAGALLALVRLARGPSLLDRVVATDVLLVIISAGLAVYAALDRDPPSSRCSWSCRCWRSSARCRWPATSAACCCSRGDGRTSAAAAREVDATGTPSGER